jgi:hypothetical protein
LFITERKWKYNTTGSAILVPLVGEAQQRKKSAKYPYSVANLTRLA